MPDIQAGDLVRVQSEYRESQDIATSGCWLVVETKLHVGLCVQGNKRKLNWNELADTFIDLTKNEFIGAVIPTPNNQLSSNQWAAAWKRVANLFEIPQLDPSAKRSSSRIIIEKANPLRAVILTIPHLSDRGQVASPTGTAQFREWHQGDITVSQLDSQESYLVVAGKWENFQDTSTPNIFQLSSP